MGGESIWRMNEGFTPPPHLQERVAELLLAGPRRGCDLVGVGHDVVGDLELEGVWV